MKMKHTFAVCAYKDSPYLEECILSLKAQTVPTNIILCTSTPSEYIYNIASKYNIPVFERNEPSDIQEDWNFAYNHADSELVTIAHQDDLYNENYAGELLKAYERYQDMTMFFCDYIPIKHGNVGEKDTNNKVKRLLRLPMKWSALSNKRWAKKGILSLGNSISCPMVTYNKRILGETIFTSDLKFGLDWDTFLKIAKIPGRFVYVDYPLGCYRIHEGATSKEFIVDKRRVKEDEEMFRKFWPGWMVKLIMIPYKKAYKAYD